MQKGQKVHVKLSASDASQLGLNSAIDVQGVISGEYTNGVKGHYIELNDNGSKRTIGVADRYNAVTPVK